MNTAEPNNGPGQLKSSTYRPIFAYYFAILHLMCVVAFAVWLAMRNSGEALVAWLCFLVVDFPVSLIVLAISVFALPFIERIMPNLSETTVVNVWYALLFGTLGTAQYYWIGKKIDEKLAR